MIQEIFGITEDLKRVCADFAGHGYEVLAPSLFDRFEPRVALDHADAEEMAKARKYAGEAPVELLVGDLQTSIDVLRPLGPVYLTGFCYGGSMTWVGAARCEGVAAASGYYGRLIPEFADEAPQCPLILHFGRNDPHIPMTFVDAIERKQPNIPIHIYEAGHGFVSNRGEDYDADAEKLARDHAPSRFLMRMLKLAKKGGGDDDPNRRCACGDIRFEITGDPMMAGECHCGQCQKSCGGNAAALMIYASAAVNIIQGDITYYTSTADSGNEVSRGFCARCGTPVLSKLGATDDVTIVKLGAMDDPSFFQPQMVLWTSTAHDWANFPEGAMQFPENPPAPG